MAFQFTKIAVKVGSNVLTRRDGTLDVTRVSALVDQIAELRKAGVEVVLISSGAVRLKYHENSTVCSSVSCILLWGKPN